MVFIYTTCRDTAEAKDMGRRIIKARVAACVNIWPMESIYFGDAGLEENPEAVLLVKTSEAKVAEIEDFILKNHSYSTPFVGMYPAQRLNREYKEWMAKQIQ